MVTKVVLGSGRIQCIIWHSEASIISGYSQQFSFTNPLKKKELGGPELEKQERMRRVAASTLVVVLCLSAFVLAESAKVLHSKGQHAEAKQDYEAAYEYYKAAYNQKPEELKYRVSFERTRFLASAGKVHRGQQLRDAGQLQDALNLFQQAQQIDPSNDLAAQEIRRTQQLMQKTAPGGAKGPGGMASKGDDDDPLRRRLESATAPAEPHDHS